MTVEFFKTWVGVFKFTEENFFIDISVVKLLWQMCLSFWMLKFETFVHETVLQTFFDGNVSFLYS